MSSRTRLRLSSLLAWTLALPGLVAAQEDGGVDTTTHRFGRQPDGAPPLGATAPVVSDDELGKRVDAFVAPLVEAGELSGTLLLARAGEVVYERSFGMADIELGVPNGADTRHCVASITKPMTIAIAARLFEAGVIAPGDTLERWLPGFPRGKQITLEHLLNHAAGIPHRVTTPEQEVVPRTAAEMVELVAAAEPIFEPGADSVYSSAGFSVLARVLELAGEAPYEDLLQEHVCRPAGMTRTLHANARQLVDGRASSYLPALEGWRNAPPADYSFLVGAGSVLSTARDLLRFQRAVLDGKLGDTARDGLVRGRSSFGWNGQTGGFRAYCDWAAEGDLSVILVANRISGANDLVRDGVALLLQGKDVPPPTVPDRTPVQLAPEVLATYAGSYQLRPGREMRVVARDGVLYMEDWLLVPVAKDRFVSPQDYAVIQVEFDDEGAVTGLDWNGFAMPRLD